MRSTIRIDAELDDDWPVSAGPQAWTIPYERCALPDQDKAFEVFRGLWESRDLAEGGRYGRLLEQRAQTYFDSERRFLGVSSGSLGLVLALQSLGLPQGSEILLPSLAPAGVAGAARANGLRPVFCDVDPLTFTLDPRDASRRVNARTSALLGVHLFGNPCDCVGLEALAQAAGLKLLFDAREAFGSGYQGESVTAFGDAGVFSFGGAKVLSAGGGGLAWFRDPKAAGRFDHLRRFGSLGGELNPHQGRHGRLSEFHAALAWLGMPQAEQSLAYRNAVRSLYRQRLSGLGFQAVREGDRSSCGELAVLVRDPGRALVELAAEGIEARRFSPQHLGDAGVEPGGRDLPVAEELGRRMLGLPLSNEFSRASVDAVAAALLEALR